MEAAAIVADGLTMRFGDVTAVDGLELTVPAGAVFGFLGTNGAGKSTTIRLLLGLLEPTSGSCQVAGFDSHRQGDDVRARCGVLLDEPGLYERLSAEENLEFYGRIWGLAPADRAARIRELLEHVGLWGRRHDQVGTFSLGMRKKLSMARALLHRPPVVFLDEPTTGLDPIARASLRTDILSLAANDNTTVFLTTHDLDEAQRMCSLVGVMQRGKLLAIGSPAELSERLEPPVRMRGRRLPGAVAALLRSQPGVRKVTEHGDAEGGALEIVLSKDVEVGPLIRLVVNAGADIEEVGRESSSLEDAFLAVIETPAAAAP